MILFPLVGGHDITFLALREGRPLSAVMEGNLFMLQEQHPSTSVVAVRFWTLLIPTDFPAIDTLGAHKGRDASRPSHGGPINRTDSKELTVLCESSSTIHFRFVTFERICVNMFTFVSKSP
jgi:hypothetical protein